jgi:hypothetical protein
VILSRCHRALAGLTLCFALLLGAALLPAQPSVYEGRPMPYAGLSPLVIDLGLPDPAPREGSLIAADLTGDGQREIIVTGPGYVAAFALSGERLWLREIDIQLTGQAESEGLPGLHAPGVQVAPLDGEEAGDAVLLLTGRGTLVALDGPSGAVRAEVAVLAPAGAERWEHLVVASFRGPGTLDLLLQATNAEGYRMGRYLAAHALAPLLAGEIDESRLWTVDDFQALAHSGARVADLDGDGRHAVLGGDLIGPDGERRLRLPVEGAHLDALHVADVRPDLPGLEVVALEEGGPERVFLYGNDGLIWEAAFERREPQNAVVGNFDPERPGLEIWNRSRYDEHQKPFVFDARGQLIAHYELAEVAPEGWTTRGLDVLSAIDWTGGERQLAVGKERHRAGDVALFDPLSGEFLLRIDAAADRLYVADVLGDWREEIIVLAGGELRIYHNPEPNPNPGRERLWADDRYLRSKLSWNYYNP